MVIITSEEWSCKTIMKLVTTYTYITCMEFITIVVVLLTHNYIGDSVNKHLYKQQQQQHVYV